MSRFTNLEFNHEDNQRFEEEPRLKDADYYLAAANRAFEQMDFDKALRLHSKVLEFDVQRVDAWTGQVRALLELGEFREAKVWADKALERFPQAPDLLAAKAVALARCGDIQAALAFSDASIEERGDSPYVWLARADVLLARREPRADYCFDKALLNAPQDWLIPWLGARIRFFYRQFAAALKLVQLAIERNSCAAAAWAQLAMCQEQLGLRAAAQTSFHQALQLDPQCKIASLPCCQARDSLLTRCARFFRRLFGS